MRVVILKPFAYAHGGHTVEHFEPAGDPVEVSEACAAVALAEGWAHLAEAPENRDAARQVRKTKTRKPETES